ncbi:MAG: sodium:solute symporter [Candidatus Obscuribacterales bacterium]
MLGAIFSIAIYGIWRTRHRHDLNTYLKGKEQTPWWAIGLSVMATQASAITFLSTPGQGYLSGLSFVQVYFGVPLALLVISIFFLPIFHHLHVYTAYEYLEKRFDGKTRLLGTFLFLLQRGIGAGLTIYAPAIVLSTVFGWSLQATIIASGVVVTLYTMMGGTDAVTVTQKYQLGIIFLGMITAVVLLISKLPAGLTFGDAMHVAGGFHKLNAVNFGIDPNERYTFWSGLLGGTFLMLSYFGTDQSQVQRYISGTSVRESRLGLLFNAVCKIPMQFCILMIGVLLFVFYQFHEPPLFFDSTANKYIDSGKASAQLANYRSEFAAQRKEVRQSLDRWVQAKHSGDGGVAGEALSQAWAAQQRAEKTQLDATTALAAENKQVKTNNADYVFITFILNELPHGVIGLLVAAFFMAALSAKSAELNALGACTTVDVYRTLIKRNASDNESVAMTRWFTALWGVVAILIALFAHFSENLIQAVNILGSIFYGVLLGLFVVAFFMKRVGGTAIFWAALTTQLLIFVCYFTLPISYLWLPLIGCAACVAFSLLLQSVLGQRADSRSVA